MQSQISAGSVAVNPNNDRWEGMHIRLLVKRKTPPSVKRNAVTCKMGYWAFYLYFQKKYSHRRDTRHYLLVGKGKPSVDFVIIAISIGITYVINSTVYDHSRFR